ncbi:hypothetical protein [Actinomadura rugatobispora]|uniref:Uncharacterized protein n=1 Tax=Actinomadura rugatobispora TaxID=1994 RepID=A0ABW1AH05_9ACTN
MSQALDLARRLLSVADDYSPTSCYLNAWARTESVLERLTTAFPDAATRSYGREGSLFPVEVTFKVGSFEEAAAALRTGMGITPCYVLWHWIFWPAVPELGLREQHKYAELEIACYSRDIFCEEPAPDHTVFVHAGPDEDRRAEWLAAQVGAEVIGPPEFGW